MALSERLALLITADSAGAVREFRRLGDAADRDLKNTDERIDRVGRTMTRVGAGMVASGALAAAALVDMGNKASDLNESVSQTEQIFGDAADQVGGFAEGATEIGQSERAAREAANTFGLFFTNIGIADDEAAGMSTTMAELASDMASFKNTTPEEAVQALGAALRGESEPIRNYGVMLDDATLKQRALDMGLIDTTTGTLPPAIRMQAAYAEVLDQTTTIQGDFERTSEGAANQQRIVTAQWENFQATLGESVLPIMQRVLNVGGGILDWFNSLDPAMQNVVSTGATVGTGFLLLGGAASTLIGQVIKMRQNFSQAGSVLRQLPARFAAASTATKALTTGAGALAAVGVAIALKQWSDEAGKVNVDFQELAESADDVMTRRFFEASLFEDDMRLFEELAETDIVAAQRLRDNLESGAFGYQASGEQLDGYNKILEETASEEQRAAEQAGERTDVVNELGTETELATEATGQMTDATEELSDAQKEFKDRIDAARDSITDFFDELMGNLDASLNYEASVDDLSASIEEHGLTLDRTTEAGRANISAVQDQAEAILALGQAHLDQGGSAEEAAGMVNIYTAGLVDQMTKAGFSEEAIRDLITQMGLTPDQVNTAFNMSGLDAARTGVANLNWLLAQTAAQSVVALASGVVGAITGNHAGGGVVEGPLGQPTLAMVHGGEVIIDPRDPRRGIEAMHDVFGNFDGGGHVSFGTDPKNEIRAINDYLDHMAAEEERRRRQERRSARRSSSKRRQFKGPTRYTGPRGRSKKRTKLTPAGYAEVTVLAQVDQIAGHLSRREASYR